MMMNLFSVRLLMELTKCIENVIRNSAELTSEDDHYINFIFGLKNTVEKYLIFFKSMFFITIFNGWCLN